MDSDEEDLRVKLLNTRDSVRRICEVLNDKQIDLIDQISILICGAVVSSQEIGMPFPEFISHITEIWMKEGGGWE
jgi:hypothetical protein